ncbi:Hypothetical protein, putative [Bodo saltans]|uniref:Uncharacterized protein n=1 Tax=Bodo saltans TaxID=75058 RepID=A0A0S4JNE5_BODSA|nr:Hypothetical protein, putative [Bodo saltans]|eukprot:CUG91418.1 Hypothetical protein, putative [Bodo saltans]
MSNTRTQHHFSSNQAHDSVLGFREHLLAEFRRGGSSLHPPHVQQSRKSPASHSRETSTDSYFIPSKRRFVDPQANAHHTLSSSSALLHENTNGVNISSRSSYLLHRSNTGDNNTDLDISAMTAHDARLAHGGVNMPPTSRPTSCHHSYVEYFVDQCLARGVPEEIIAQHALYMIHSMRDGIYLYSELHRHRQNEAQLEHDMQDLSLQLMKSSRATSRATSPQQRRLLRSSGTMKNGVATTRSPAPSSPKVAHEPSLSAAAAARQESSGRVNDLPPSVNVSPESVMFRFPSPSRGGAAVLHGGESVSVLDDVLDTPPRNGREGEVHSGGSFSEQPVAPTDELRSSDAVAKRLDLRDDGIEHRAAHPQQSSRSSASSSTARNLAAGPTNHHQSTKSSMMEYNRTHRRVDPSSSSRHVAAPQQQNGPTASRESQAGRPSSQTGTQQSRGPPPPSTAADVVYTSRRTVTSNEILQRTTTTIQQPKPRGGNDVFSQHRLAEASSGTSGGLRRGSAVNSSSATLQRRPSFSSAGSFRIERNESQAQLVDRLSTPKKNSLKLPLAPVVDFEGVVQ